MPELLPISIITGCKGRLSYLRQTLPAWLALPVAEIIIVDADCPDKTADWVDSLNDPRVRAVRLPPPIPLYHHAQIKNAGGRAARGDWLVFFDSDILPSPAFSSVLSDLHPNSFYRADSGAEGLAGQVVLPRPAYEKLGGFDEAYINYSDEDIDLYRRLLFHRYEQRTFPSALLHHLPHSDALRTSHQTEKSRALSLLFNTAYGLIKIDIMRLTGTELTPAFRTALFQTVQTKFREAIQTNTPQRIELLLPPIPMSLEHLYGRTFVATLNPPTPGQITRTS